MPGILFLRLPILQVDTRRYGLPQTRLRGYMLVWRPDLVENKEVRPVLGQFWEALMVALEVEVPHSVDAFLVSGLQV